MSIVVVPGQFHGAPHPAGKLASTLLSVTVAGMADPARFRRGKSYVLQHAVNRLEVTPGVLKATVAGSRSVPYQVVVSVAVLPPVPLSSPDALRTQLNRLTPEAGELLTSCTCPDMDDPCKHVVAGILAFAGELVMRPELLVQWRTAPDGTEPERPRVGSRARASERHLRLAPPLADRSPAVSPWETPEWVAFLGTKPPPLPDVPHERAPVGLAMAGTVDLAEVVRSALDALTADD